MRWLLALVLLAPALSGCLADIGEPPTASAGTKSPEGTLPAGLEMDGAEVVAYNDTSIVWRWTSTADPGLYTGSPVHQTAAFDVPTGMPLAVEGDLTWSDGEARALRIAIHDAGGERLCQGIPHFGPGGPERVSCAGFHPAPEAGERSSVEVQTYLAEEPTPFELTLRLTIGTPGIDPIQPSAPEGPDGTGEPAHPHTVIGFGDTGINPYHEAYRDDSPEAYQHPSTYIDGYPEEAVALNLTLEAPTYADAVGADAELWESLERGQLYWIPGTKIIGAYAPDEPRSYNQSFCRPVLDCNGHGSGMAARALGNDRSLCDECKLVEVQGYQTGLEWMAEQAWIDITVIEYCYYTVREDRVGDRAEDDALMTKKPVFLSSGNGIQNSGGAGQPTAVGCFHQGLPNAISVGAHNDGRIARGFNTMPHVAADACTAYPRHDAMAEDRFGCGTSLSVPYAAGGAGAMVQAARELLGDHVGGLRGDVLARGQVDLVKQGPLEDGDLTIEELRHVLFTTADPRPGRGEHGGPYCGPTDPDVTCQWTTTPIEWQTVPEGVPQYYWMGYGAITPASLDHALRVLRGQQPMPERPVEDAFFTLDYAVRQALVATDPGSSHIPPGERDSRTYLNHREK